VQKERKNEARRRRRGGRIFGAVKNDCQVGSLKKPKKKKKECPSRTNTAKGKEKKEVTVNGKDHTTQTMGRKVKKSFHNPGFP